MESLWSCRRRCTLPDWEFASVGARKQASDAFVRYWQGLRDGFDKRCERLWQEGCSKMWFQARPLRARGQESQVEAKLWRS